MFLWQLILSNLINKHNEINLILIKHKHRNFTAWEIIVSLSEYPLAVKQNSFKAFDIEVLSWFYGK